MRYVIENPEISKNNLVHTWIFVTPGLKNPYEILPEFHPVLLRDDDNQNPVKLHGRAFQNVLIIRCS
ncbi:MAG: hypothetical protein C4522_05890 [Desulfobacteraceae bacterium]|nr:MAG: hypothetical protein C4522_05890 [Desulfobacteraceae bacterium]